MADKGGVGIELDLDQVPMRETGMSAYEMMLSESQERMLMVLRPEKEKQAEAIFRKWGLDFAIVGRTTDDLRFRVVHGGKVEADLPIKDLGDQAPEYDRPFVKRPAQPPLSAPINTMDCGEALLRILNSPDMGSRRFVWEQYDHLIQGNTAQRPGGDAAVIRVDGTRRENVERPSGATGKQKGLAFSLDVTPRYCAADPFEGGKQAVAECWRNLTAVGAEPLAITDNLNFGNPERPEIMGELVAAIEGISAACKALDFPVVSGNVSLYNETNGRAIPPTPAIGGVGLLADIDRMATLAFKAEGEAIILCGAPPSWGGHLGQSIYLREIHGREEGPPPPVDLAHERKVGEFVRGLIHERLATAVHDLSDGGLAVALAEMAMASGIGATINQLNDIPPTPVFFGEDQGRYLVTLRSADLDGVLGRAREAGIPVARIGNTGGTGLKLGNSDAISVAKLRQAYETWFPAFMAGRQ
jgi:phosphoribosylformylglycinamidine synthase